MIGPVDGVDNDVPPENATADIDQGEFCLLVMIINDIASLIVNFSCMRYKEENFRYSIPTDNLRFAFSK